MRLRLAVFRCLGLAALVAAGCAPSIDPAELGETKQEFESSSQGGNYRFQYVADGSDGYRTVLWRQGESLSDDGKDGALVAGVVKSVFRERFCKELKVPASLAEGSPAPTGKEGKWTASLRCAEPPPPPPKAKPEKKKPKPKPVETAEPSKPAEESKPEKAVEYVEPAEKPAKPPKPVREAATEEAKPRAMDGPMECVARKAGDGFDCKPIRR